MTEYTYGPGEWTALAHGGRAALLDPAIDAGSVDQIWELLSRDGALESWLEVLAGNGLAALPSFGFVELGDDGVRVVVRGDVVALVDDYDISAGGMRTWREHVAPAGTGVVLRAGEGEVRYPLVGGVVLASVVQIGEVAAVTDDAAPADTENEVPDTDTDADVAAAATAAAAELQPEPEPSTEAQQAELEAPVEPEDAEAPTPLEPEHAEPADAEPEHAEPESAAEPELAEGEVEPDFVLDDDDEDDLGDDPEGEWAQQAEAVQLTDLPDGQHASGEAPPPWAPPPGVVPSPAAAQWGPPGGAAPEAVAPQGEPDLGDHDGYTMRASDVPGTEAAASDVDHVDQTLAPAREDEHDEGGGSDEPQLQLALSTGQQVELDRPVLIGRAPESSRFGFGQTPRLVTVPSPQQDISRTHVEIKLEGDSVLVTDLRSTNGTVVVLPGSPPRRLHPGESVPVPAGTVVDLGDGVTAVVALPATTTPIAY